MDLGAMYRSGKPVALGIVVLFSLLHSFRLFSGWGTCDMLLGRPDGYEFVNFAGHWWEDHWRPAGCMMHHYTKKTLPACLKQRTVEFIGDSRMRQLYNYTSMLLTDGKVSSKGKIHSDLTHRDEELDINLNFRWAPEYEGKELQEVYERFKTQGYPDLLLHSSGLWAMKRKEDTLSMAENFQNVKSLLLEASSSGSVAYWLPLAHVVEDQLWDARKEITNEKVDELNHMISSILPESNNHFSRQPIHQLNNIQTIFDSHVEPTLEDGLHFSDILLQAQMDVILTSFCNNQVGYPIPVDSDCCAPTEPITLNQVVIGLLLSGCGCWFLWLSYGQTRIPIEVDIEANATDTQKSKPDAPTSTIFYPLSQIGLLMFYLFLCDRTPLFMKESKEWSIWRFIIPSAFLFVLLICMGKVSFLTTKKSDGTVLNRNQTDEWKGWMQMLILVYHYVGASKILPIYVLIRVFVGSYLFMTGYGHFCFFYKKQSYELLRVCQVLLRVNLFAIFLVLVMAREYQFYYFVPLSSFWFLVVCATMWPLSKSNHSTWVLMGKFAVLFLLCIVIWLPRADGSFPTIKAIFGVPPLYQLFSEHGSLHEWGFRSGLDRFATPFGMLLGYLFLRLSEMEVMDNSNRYLFKPMWAGLVAAFCCAVFVFYGWFVNSCPSKPECNQIHAVSSLLLITAFVFARNMYSAWRGTYSTFMASTGKISLELFLGQYHMWLARDTRGVLVFIPGYPILNACFTTVVFIYCANYFSEAFNALLLHVLPKGCDTVPRRIAAMGAAVIGFYSLSVLSNS